MSLINIRTSVTDTTKYQSHVITVTAAGSYNGSTATTFTISGADNQQAVKRFIKVGMRILNIDNSSPHPAAHGTTTNPVTAVGSAGESITVDGDASSFGGGGTVTFTTVNALNTPLTNAQLDGNFLEIERTKVGIDGAQNITGNLEIRRSGDATANGFSTDNGNLFVSEKIVAKSIDIGGTGGTATLTTEGDIEANNIKLSGEIDDRSLFEKYGITRFKDSLLLNYDNPTNAFTASSVLFLEDVSSYNINTSHQGSSSQKAGLVLRKSTDENYVIVKETGDATSLAKEWTVGETFGSAGSKIKRALRGKDLLKVHQQIKIFGTQMGPDVIRPSTPSASCSRIITTANAADSGITQVTYRYKLVAFNPESGKLSDPSSAILIGTDPSSPGTNVPLDKLDESNFNRILIDRQSTAVNVLVYRSINSTQNSDFKLISILGPQELGNDQSGIPFDDRGSFTQNSWSKRSVDSTSDTADAGAYLTTTGLQFLPLTPTITEQQLRGFDYVRVKTIDKSNNVTFGRRNTSATAVPPSSNKPPTGTLEFYHDNSVMHSDAFRNVVVGGLQFLVDEKKSEGFTHVKLPEGTYHTGLIKLPTNFTLEGSSKQNTVLKLVPWNSATSNTHNRKSTDPYYQSTNYSNTILVAEKCNNVTIQNLKIDGNFINEVRHISSAGPVSTSTFEDLTNFLVKADGLQSAVQYENLLLRNVHITNSVEGGLYAPNSKKLSIENCDFSDSGTDITTDEFSTPAYLASSDKLTIVNSRFSNFPFAINATSALAGNIVGNVIQDCGTGLITYGSSNLITTPNLILGANNEFIGAVDTLDTDFDSINIDLSSEPSGTDYTSDSIQYLRDGEKAHLFNADKVDDGGNIFGTRVSIRSDINTLVQDGNFDYLIDKTAGANSQFNFNNAASTIEIAGAADDLKQGLFKIKISSVKRANLLADSAAGGTDRATLQGNYNNLAGRPDGEKLIGMVYDIIAKEYTNMDTTDTAITFDSFQSITGGNTLRLSGVNSTQIGNLAVGDRVLIRHENASRAHVTIPAQNGDTGSVMNACCSKAGRTPTEIIDHEITAIDRVSGTIDLLINNDGFGVINNTTGSSAYDIAAGNVGKLGIKNEFSIIRGRLIL